MFKLHVIGIKIMIMVVCTIILEVYHHFYHRPWLSEAQTPELSVSNSVFQPEEEKKKQGLPEREEVRLCKDQGAGILPCIQHSRQSVSAGQDCPPQGSWGVSLVGTPSQPGYNCAVHDSIAKVCTCCQQ